MLLLQGIWSLKMSLGELGRGCAGLVVRDISGHGGPGEQIIKFSAGVGSRSLEVMIAQEIHITVLIEVVHIAI